MIKLYIFEKKVPEDYETLMSKKLGLKLSHSYLGQPIILNQSKNISISHSGDKLFIAISNYKIKLGIDVQKNTQVNLPMFNSDMIKSNYSHLQVEGTSLKEALGKYLGIGLLADPKLYQLEKIELQNKNMYLCKFKMIPFLTGITLNNGLYIYSIVFDNTVNISLLTEELIRSINEL